MRPTTSTMLQQNNNNNYPCLNVSGSTREMIHKCSRASLPFPSRLELGLGDLPLIRGLRAWALCSKNRRKAPLVGGQAPTAPPGSSASCPRPADVYLSGEWGRMGYGLPLGLDARQAGIGALVATLKTSEGNGKTQTQCLFLQTEKGSCLYSTAKPGSGVSSSSASSVAGGWLRGKAGGGRDIPAGRRDPRPTLQAQTGANRVRVRSGLRWRKSGNAAGREKTGASKEKQQRSGEDPAEEIIVRERQEERDKGGLDSREFPSPQQDDRRARQEREGACRSPRCRHSASLKTCTQCGRRAQRRGSQEGSDSPTAGAPTRQDSDEKEWQKTEEEEKGALCGLEGDKSISNSDLKSERFHPESFSGCDADGIREATSQPELKTQTSHSDFSEEDDDTRPGCMKRHTANKDSLHSRPENSCEEIVVNVNGSSDQVKLAEAEGGLVREDGGRITSSSSFEDVSFSSFPVSSGAVVSPARTTEPSGPAEGSSAEHEDDMQESSKGEGDAGTGGEDQPGVGRLEANCVDECGNNTVNTKLNNTAQFFFQIEGDSSQQEERKTSIAEKNKRIITDNTCNFSEAELRERDELLGGNGEEGVNPEERDEGGERYTCIDVEGVGGKGEDDEDWQPGGKKDDSVTQNCEEVKRKCEVKDGRRIQGSADGRTEEEGDTRCVKIETDADVTDDPSTSLVLSPANPAPSLRPLGAMATSLPCLEAEEGRVRAAGGGQEGKRRHRRELESPEQQQGEEEAVDTEEGRREEEDEFGVFMQAEGEPAWSEEFTMSASVPCGSRGSVALGNGAVTEESTDWTPSWTQSSFHQSDDAWTAFPQDVSDEGRDAAGQWWSTSEEEEERRDQNLASLFAEAFPSLPDSSSSVPSDAVPTLTQLLRGGTSQDQGLLDSFHDLNKMIGQRYKRARGMSRELLMKTLHLEPPPIESRPVHRSAHRRLSPGLPSANQHPQNAAAKRRLSCDYHRNMME